MSRPLHVWSAALLVALANAGPASALAAELPALERAWHNCVRNAYDHQPEHGSRAGRERNALDECKPARGRVRGGADGGTVRCRPTSGWLGRDLGGDVSFVVDPVKAWIEAPGWIRANTGSRRLQ